MSAGWALPTRPIPGEADEVKSWSKEQRALFSDALRLGEPVELKLNTGLGRGRRAQRNMRMDEVAPLVASIQIDDPELHAAAEVWKAPQRTEGRTETVTAVIPCNRDIPLGLKA